MKIPSEERETILENFVIGRESRKSIKFSFSMTILLLMLEASSH
jgi:hypothetical protein